jgi:DNA invertase Pin-like site-specific DNA recombinase
LPHPANERFRITSIKYISVLDAGAHFRSLGDPIDTSGPSGMPVLQIMGAIARFERTLIVERTKAGLASCPTW